MKKPGNYDKKRHHVWKSVESYDLNDPDDKADYELLLNDPSVEITKEIRNFSNVHSTMNVTVWFNSSKKKR